MRFFCLIFRVVVLAGALGLNTLHMAWARADVVCTGARLSPQQVAVIRASFYEEIWLRRSHSDDVDQILRDSYLRLGLEGDVNVNSKALDQFGATLLMRAAGWGHHDFIKAFLEAGADVNVQDDNGNTVIHRQWTREKDGVDAMQLLLESEGVDLNIRNKSGDTLLFSFSQLSPVNNYSYYLPVVKLLLEKGVDVNAQNAFGETALMGAPSEVIKLFLQHNADVNIQGNNGNTALMRLASESPLALKAMIRNGKDFDPSVHSSNEVITSRLVNIEQERLKAAKLLLDAGADTSIKNKNGQTALDLAKKNKKYNHSDQSDRIVNLIRRAHNQNIQAAATGCASLLSNPIK